MFWPRDVVLRTCEHLNSASQSLIWITVHYRIDSALISFLISFMSSCHESPSAVDANPSPLLEHPDCRICVLMYATSELC